MEIILLICVPSYGYWAKIGLPIFSRRAGILKRVDDWNADGHVKSGDDSWISDINFVRFSPPIPQLYCVQQASIGIRVTSSTFARGQHCQALRRLVHGFVSLLLAMERQCCVGRPSGLHARLCHAFLVANCYAHLNIYMQLIDVYTKGRSLHLAV